MNFKDKQAWILSTQNHMFDQKSLTVNLYPKPPKQKEKPTLLKKKPKQLEPIDNKTHKLSSSLKNDELLIKKQINPLNKSPEFEIPEVGEWEFEEESSNDVWEMMDGFEDKINRKKESMSEIERLELEHKKMINMTERIKQK